MRSKIWGLLHSDSARHMTARFQRFTRRNHPLHQLMSATLAATMLAVPVAVVTASPAAAANSTPCAAGDTAGRMNGNTSITVTPSHGKAFYIDSSQGQNMDAAYVGYQVRSSIALKGLWARIDTFTGGVISLANQVDANQALPDFAGSDTKTAFFLLKASSASTLQQKHIFSVFDGNPILATSRVLYSCQYTFSKVSETIKASPNKVVNKSGPTPAAPSIGGTFSMTITGDTGKVGAGSSPDYDTMWLNPVPRSSFPTSAVRLEATSATVYTNGCQGNGSVPSSGSSTTYVNQLAIPALSSYANNGGGCYQVTYTFRVLGSAPAITLTPNAMIASGTQMKHVNLTDAAGQLTLDLSAAKATGLSISKTVDTSTAFETRTVGGTQYLRVKYKATLSDTSTTAVSIDQLLDSPDSRTLISTTDSYTVSVGGAAATSYPMPGAKTSSGDVVFSGPIAVPAQSTTVLSYYMLIPYCSSGSATAYNNSIRALIGQTIVGSASSGYIPTASVQQTACGSTTVSVTQSSTKLTIAAITMPASGVDTSIATLNGSVNFNMNDTATIYFEYSTSPTLATVIDSPLATPQPTVTSALVTLESKALTGLSQSTTYYFRIRVGIGAMAIYGDIYSFTTTQVAAPPTATTNAPTSVSISTAVLNGSIDANLTSTNVYLLIESTTALTLSSNATVYELTDDVYSKYANGTNNYTVLSSAGAVAFSIDFLSLYNAAGAGTNSALVPILKSALNPTAGYTYLYAFYADTSATASTTSGTTTPNVAGLPAQQFSLVAHSSQTVTLSSAQDVYYGSTETFTVSSSSTLPVSLTVSGLCTIDTGTPGALTSTTVASGSTVNVRNSGTGTCGISADQKGGTVGSTVYNALSEPVAQTFQVLPLPIAITATSANISYGSARPTFTWSASPALVGTDAIGSVTYSDNPSIDPLPAAGNYVRTPSSVSLSTGSLSNYAFSFVAGTLTVNPKSITVKPSSASRTYGLANPTFTLSATSGLIGADAISSATETTSATSTSNVGTYPIYASSAVFSSGSASNYNITYASDTLTITAKPETITASSESVNFGTAAGAPTWSLSPGLLNGDTISVSVATSYTDTSSVGSYPTVATRTGFTGAGSSVVGNYSFTIVDGAITVTKRGITVKADPKSKYYHTDNPTLTASVTGTLAAGDAITAETLTTTALHESYAGAYPISVTGVTMSPGNVSNYNITYVNDTLTVLKQDETVTATNATKVYGHDLPTFGYTSTPALNGTDTFTSVTFNTSATASSTVGDYPITPQATIAPNGDNYTIHPVNGTLTITQHPITLKADKLSVAVNQPLPSSYGYSYTAADLQSGDTIDSITVTSPGASTANVGNKYPIQISSARIMHGATDVTSSYNITYVNDTLTIVATIRSILLIGNGGSIAGQAVETVTTSDAETVALADYTPTYTGHHLTEWTTSSNSGTYGPLATLTVSGDETLTAQWAIDTHTVTTAISGQGSATYGGVMDWGTTATETATASVTGWHFTGWTGCSGTTSNGGLTITFTVLGDVTCTANFALDTHTVTYAHTAGGSIQGNTPQTRNYGSSTDEVTALPSTGYHFVQWSDGSTSLTRSDTVTATVTFTATFAIDTHTVSYDKGDGDSGSVASQQVNYGTTPVTAANGFVYAHHTFTGWKDLASGSTYTAGTSTSAVTTDITLTAQWTITPPSIKLDSTTAGIASPYTSLAETVTVLHPITTLLIDTGTSDALIDSYTIDALATDLVFDTTTGTLSGTPSVVQSATTYTITAHGPGGSDAVAYTLTVRPQFYTLTATFSGSGSVSAASQSIESGTVGTITATPAAHWHVGSYSVSNGGTCAVLTSTTCSITMTNDFTVTANFVSDTVTLTYIAGSNGHLEVGGTTYSTYTTSINYGANGPAVSAIAGSGYSFSTWTNASSANPRTDSNVISDLTQTASFTANAPTTFDLTVGSTGSGSTSPTSGTHTYNSGTSVNVVATPSPTWRFGSWSGCDSTSSETCTVTMSSAKSVSVTFIKTFKVETKTVGTGAVGLNGAAVVDTGTSRTVTANPSPGWRFGSWNGCSSSTDTCTITLTQDETVTANFIKIWDLAVDEVGGATVTFDTSTAFAAPSHGRATFDTDTVVTITAAAPGTGYRLIWSGTSCSGNSETCTVTLREAHNETVTRSAIAPGIALRTSSTTRGQDYSETITVGESLELTIDTGSSGALIDSYTIDAVPDGLTFETATGHLYGTPRNWQHATTYTITAHSPGGNSSAHYSLTVNKRLYRLTASHDASAGSVSATTQDIESGTVGTVRATANAGWRFLSWDNCASGNETCTVTMNSDKSVTANFKKIWDLAVTEVGGAVVTFDTGTAFAAPSHGRATFDTGTAVTITATPAPTGYRLTWSGTTCNGNGNSCTVTLREAHNETVTLSAIQPGIGLTRRATNQGKNDAQTIYLGESIDTVTVDIGSTGAAIDSYTVDVLPLGLVFESTTGTLAGTPSETGTTVMTITAHSPGGTDTATYTLTVLDLFIVTFDANGGTGTMIPQQGNGTAALRNNSFNRSGYSFNAWNTQANGGGTSYANRGNFPFAQSVTLFAQWTQNRQNNNDDEERGKPATPVVTPPVEPPAEPKHETPKPVTPPAPPTQRSTVATRPVTIPLPTVETGTSLVVDEERLPAAKGIAAAKLEDGKVTFVATPGFSGKTEVPLVFTNTDGTETTVMAPVVVNPETPRSGTFTAASATKTVITWEPSPNAIAYDVSINGKLACNDVTTTQCAVAALHGPNNKVDVTAVGNDGTTSTKAVPAYVPDVVIPIVNVHFAENKAILSAADKVVLNKFVTLMKREGFTHVYITGYTDNQGGAKNALPLSLKRAQVTAAYLAKSLDVTIRNQALGQRNPVASNATKSGQARNRRAEVGVK